MPQRPDAAARMRPAAERPLLTPLRAAAHPAARPVVAVHPGALPPAVWHDLAAALPEHSTPYLCDLGTVPAYVTAALDPAAPVPGVRDLAARCLGELTAAGLTDGPLTLVGWSFGGVVALEIAARLDARGAGPVTGLVVLDSIAPVAAFQRADDQLDPPTLLGWFAMYLGARRGHDLTLAPGALDGHGEDDGLDVLLGAALAQGVLPAGTEPAGLRKLYTAFRSGLLRNNRCTAGYLPAPLHTPITLLMPRRSLLPDSPDLGWEQLGTRPLRRIDVPGDHYTMLQQPRTAAVLAALLAAPDAVAPRTG
ncbi:thioesterase domain-containing protein [Streptomyces sp. NPDC014806]|uniref:thioesterase domain-containing protein n=1 Tax=Streptomyces sp. NPDC014806 TaxID=3364920 RepID=UPI00370152BB